VGNPPPKPRGKTEPEDLAEVERALSVLQGRHPEFVKAEREAKRSAEERQKFARAELEALDRRAFRKKVGFGVAGAGAVALAVVIGTACSRARALSDGLDRTSVAYLPAGFTVAASSSLWSAARVEAQLGPGCAIVLTSKDAPPQEVRVQHGPSTIIGQGAVGWCACNDEIAVATLAGRGDGKVGLRIVHAEGHVIGGRREFGSSPLRPETLGPGGDECAEADLDAWLEEKRYPRVAAAAPWIDPARIATLGASGFALVAAAPHGNRFAIVEPKEGRCYVAFGANAEDHLSLRVTGPEHAVADGAGPVAWCDSRPTQFTVWTDGATDAAVLAAPAARVGGLLGAIETATRAGAAPRATWLRAEDHGWNARALLKGSGLADAVTIVPESTPPIDVPNARFVGISLGDDARIEPDQVADLLFFCSPAFETHAPQSLCVETGALKWRRAGWRPAGAAAATFPFWMQLFESEQNPEVLKLELGLLALARRLGAQGFEPTVLEGVKERRTGEIEVLGRAGEDAVVALGLFARPPWVAPYTNGPDWNLGDDPRVVPLEPGNTVTLTARLVRTLKPEEAGEKSAAARRTVVFRRAAK
jgi:hypothetical protein